MTSQLTEDFVGRFRRLPRRIQDLARKNYRLWKRDPAHPSTTNCSNSSRQERAVDCMAGRGGVCRARYAAGEGGTTAESMADPSPNAGPAADAFQPLLLRRSGFQARLRPSVIAPRQAWRLLQGASPGRVRGSHPPVARRASMAESWLSAHDAHDGRSVDRVSGRPEG